MKNEHLRYLETKVFLTNLQLFIKIRCLKGDLQKKWNTYHQKCTASKKLMIMKTMILLITTVMKKVKERYRQIDKDIFIITSTNLSCNRCGSTLDRNRFLTEYKQISNYKDFVRKT